MPSALANSIIPVPCGRLSSSRQLFLSDEWPRVHWWSSSPRRSLPRRSPLSKLSPRARPRRLFIFSRRVIPPQNMSRKCRKSGSKIRRATRCVATRLQLLTNHFPGCDCDHIVRHHAHRSMLALRGVRTFHDPSHGHGRGSDSDCAGGGNLAGS